MAVQIAQLSIAYPQLKAWAIDDFNWACLLYDDEQAPVE